MAAQTAIHDTPHPGVLLRFAQTGFAASSTSKFFVIPAQADTHDAAQIGSVIHVE
jgi:hypothetical protein